MLPGAGWPWTVCNGKGVFVPACPRALELIAGIDPIDGAGGSSTARPAQRLRGAPGGSWAVTGGSAPAPPPSLLPRAGLTASKVVPSSAVLNNTVTCGRGWCVEGSRDATSLRCLGCAMWLLHDPVHSLTQPHEGLGCPAPWQGVTVFPHHVLTSTREPTGLGQPLPCPCHLSPKQSRVEVPDPAAEPSRRDQNSSSFPSGSCSFVRLGQLNPSVTVDGSMSQWIRWESCSSGHLS